MRLIKADTATVEACGRARLEEAADEACSSDVSDQQAIPACVRGAAGAGLMPLAPSPAGPAAADVSLSGPAAPPSLHLGEAALCGSSSSLASSVAAGGAMGPPHLAPAPSTGSSKRSAAAAALGAPGGGAAKRATPASSPAVSAAAAPQLSSTAAGPPHAPHAAFALPPSALAGCAPPPAGGYHAAPAAAPAGAWAPGGWDAPTPTSGGVVVTCNGLQGLLDLSDMMIVVGAGGRQHQGARVLPEAFEAIAGKSSTRKWRRSLVVHPGGADAGLTQPVTLGDWLARWPELEARLPPRGSGRAAARAALAGGADGAGAAAPRRPSGDGARGGGRVSGDGSGAARSGGLERTKSRGGSASSRDTARPDAAAAPPAPAPRRGTDDGAASPGGSLGPAVRWLPVQCIGLSGWLDLSDFSVLVPNPKVAGGGGGDWQLGSARTRHRPAPPRRCPRATAPSRLLPLSTPARPPLPAAAALTHPGRRLQDDPRRV
jgi:hypothetical protein